MAVPSIVTTAIVSGQPNAAAAVKTALDNIKAGIASGTSDTSTNKMTAADDIEMTGGATKKLNLGASKVSTGANSAFKAQWIPGDYVYYLTAVPTINIDGSASRLDNGSYNLKLPIPLKMFNVAPTIRGITLTWKYVTNSGAQIEFLIYKVNADGTSTAVVDHAFAVVPASATAHTIYFTADGESGTPIAIDAAALGYYICIIGSNHDGTHGSQVWGGSVIYDLVP